MQEVYILKSKFKYYYDLWMKERKHLGVPDDIDDIFIKKEDGIWKKAKESQLNYYAEYFTKLLDTDFYWHSIRHNFTTTLLADGIPESIVQKIVGWQSADMVNLYNDADKDDVIGEYFKDGEIVTKEKKGLSDL